MRSTRLTVPTADELAALASARRSDAVSLLLPPLPSAEAHLTLRNLLKDVEQHLSESLRTTEVADRLRPVQDVLDDHEVWAPPTVCLALYLDAEQLHATVGPENGTPLAVVAPRFQVTHLLYAAPVRRYAVLVLTRGTTHLYGDRGSGLTEITTKGLPAEMADVLRYDDREPQLQSHGSARRGAGNVVAAFHGQGGRGDHPEDVARYLRFVAAEVEEVLGGEPLVLAATSELASAYRKISDYAAIEDESIAGNAERTALPALADQAESIVMASEVRRRRASVEELVAGDAAGSLVCDLGAILTAAHDGRVDRLAVASGFQVWGRYDPEQRRVFELVEPKGQVDLVNEAVAETWLHGGEVVPMPDERIPGPWHMAALMRF